MKVAQIKYPLDPAPLSAIAERMSLAVGDFDGVHRGHGRVIGRAVETAREDGVAAAVMTFHPHPREVLGSPVYASHITPLSEKLEQFAALGVDTAYVVHFDRVLASLSPAAFVDEVLVPLKVKTVVVGFNFTFGHRGAGTAETLKALAEGRFVVEVVDPVLEGGERVSSTLIRQALNAGDVSRARTLLGRPYAVCGTVVQGEGRGRTIGVPTANLRLDDAYVVPARGVYAVRVETVDGKERFNGVLNIGLKPTFHAAWPEPTWEVHLFDFSGDLYGRRLRVHFISRIRSERKFDSIEALVNQIRRDMEQARLRLGDGLRKM